MAHKLKTYIRNVDGKQLAILLAILVLIFFLWNTMLIYPLKVLVVLFHELGHGLAAALTGGKMTEINLSSNLGGTCWSIGGNRFVVLSAGYLGSLAFGGIILLIAARSEHDHWLAKGLGGLIGLIGVFYVRPWFSFGWFFCLAGGLGLFLSGQFLPGRFNDIVLKVIGLTSCMYAPLDIFDDLIFRSIPGSDAYELGKLTFIPGVVWGVFWALLAIGMAFFFILLAVQRNTAPPKKSVSTANR